MLGLLGYAAALVVGLLLAVVGGGGAILALPVLVYAFGLAPWDATLYSLFVVGCTAGIGAARHARSGTIDYGAAVRFALPAVLAIRLVRSVVVPALPSVWTLPSGHVLTKDHVVIAALVLAMLGSALAMLRNAADSGPEGPKAARRRPVASMMRGFAVGAFTGLVGAGGGFCSCRR